MTAPTVTNTFTNGTTADATAVNQNFTDLVNAMTDGTKTFSIDALTCAGAATFNGAVNLGNATGDDITCTGYIASDLIPKTDDNNHLGTSSKAWKDAYFDGTVYTDAISQHGTGGISITGAMIPASDDTHDLGTAALAWQDGYFDGTVYTDDITELTSLAGTSVKGRSNGTASKSGCLGELATGTSSNINLSTGVTVDAASCAVQPGNWLFYGKVYYEITAAPITSTARAVSISRTSATHDILAQNYHVMPTSNDNVVMSTPKYTVVTAATSVYLVADSTFAGSGTYRVNAANTVLYGVRVG